MVTRKNLKKFVIVLTILSLVSSVGFAKERVIISSNYIAVPSSKYAFKHGKLNIWGRELDELVRQSADLVCEKNGYERAGAVEIEPSSLNEKVYLVKDRLGRIVESKPELTRPWEFHFKDEIYEARIESVKMKLTVTGTVCGLVGGCFGGIAAAIPPTAPVTAPVASVFGGIAAGMVGAVEALTKLKGPLKEPVKKKIESKNKFGGDRTALGKYARNLKFFKVYEKDEDGQVLDLVPHLVFKRVDCVPKKSVFKRIKDWFFKPKAGENKFNVNYEDTQFASLGYAEKSISDRIIKQSNAGVRNGWSGARNERRELRRGCIVKAL